MELRTSRGFFLIHVERLWSMRLRAGLTSRGRILGLTEDHGLDAGLGHT